MQFRSFHWLSHHGLWTIIPCSTNMVSVCVFFFLEPFYFFLSIGGFFDKTIIPLALVGYEMIIANSYPMHTHGIIVKYSFLMNHCSNKKK